MTAPLRVVADGRVPAVFVRAVELDPGVVRRVGHRLHQPARRGLQRLDLAGQRLQVLVPGRDSGAVDDQGAVVGGQPLHHPEAGGVRLALVVERPERGGPQLLDVPRVEQLVAGRAEPAEIAAAVAGGPAAGHEQGRVLVLEPAPRLDQQVQKEVAAVGEEAPDPVLLPHDALDVGGGPRTVPDPAFADVDQGVGRAVHREGVGGRIAGDDGRVDQRVEVRRAVAVRQAVRRRGQGGHALAPAGGRLDADVVGARCRFGQGQERGGAVQHCEVGLDPVRADAHLPAVDPVGHRDPVRAGGLDAPPVLARLGDRQRLPVRGGRAHRLDVPGIFPDQVGAGRPGRHHQLDGGPAVHRQHRFHLGVVRGRRRKADGVRDRIKGLRKRRCRSGQEQDDGEDPKRERLAAGSRHSILLSNGQLYHRSRGLLRVSVRDTDSACRLLPTGLACQGQGGPGPRTLLL